MAKKNLPNIPIYIGDWERDCNVLDLESEAAWMRIVFKLWTKGKQNSIKMPTKAVQNLWRCSNEKMLEIIDDLKYNEICGIVLSKGFVEFTCRRFVRENYISQVRSDAVSNREDRKDISTNDLQTSHKDEQNADNDYDNESNYDIEDVNEDEIKIEIFPTFEDFWNLYDKKVGKVKSEKKWNKLSQQKKEIIMDHIPNYKYSEPRKKFRKNPETYFNNESWNDEIIVEEKIIKPEQINAGILLMQEKQNERV